MISITNIIPWRNLVFVLQVTEDSLSKASEMQDHLTEAYEGHQELVKKLQTSEEEKKKMKYEVQCLQLKVNEREERGSSLME